MRTLLTIMADPDMKTACTRQQKQDEDGETHALPVLSPPEKNKGRKRRKSSQAFTVSFGEPTEEINLQKSFLKYRKSRQAEIKQEKLARERELRAQADPDKLWALRMKFVEQCKKYFGYPYAKKYWTPNDPEYSSTLFLDCCGLVRRVLRDLRKEFGFRVGPWNQAYMYDTLPLTITEEEMKPGDLVFISAIYYSSKSKKQPHNMTHVEVWLGDGPKTIGARWQKGKVQVFDSYRFTAKSYHSEQYHFKSIDTWLMGICRSHCKEHKWTRAKRKTKLSDRSIFTVKHEDMFSSDQNASDTDGDIVVSAATAGQSPNSAAAQNKNDESETSTAPSHDNIPLSSPKDVITSFKPENTQATPAGEQTNSGPSAADSNSTSSSDHSLVDNASVIPKLPPTSCVNQTVNCAEDDHPLTSSQAGPQTSLSDCEHMSTSGHFIDDQLSTDDLSDEDEGHVCGEHKQALNVTVDPSDYFNCVPDCCCFSDIYIDSDNEDDVEQVSFSRQTDTSCDSTDTDLDDESESQGEYVTGELGISSDDEYLDFTDHSSHADVAYNPDQDDVIDKKGAAASIMADSRLSGQFSDVSSTLRDLEMLMLNSDDDVSEPAESDSKGEGQGGTNGQKNDKERNSKNEQNSSDGGGQKKGGKKSPDSGDNNKSGGGGGGAGGGNGGNAPRSRTLLATNQQPTFYIGGGNGVALVEAPLVAMGWRRITDKHDENFKLKWVELKSQINYQGFKEGEQLVNHIPNCNLLTNKLGLLNSLQEFERVTNSVKRTRGARLKLVDFLPETYRLDDKNEREIFFETFKEGDIWICKPTGMNQGKGIYLVRDVEEIRKTLQESDEKKQGSKPYKSTMGRIIQRYITNPLLLEGRKFDIRAYLLIASTVPYVVLYHQGYVRLSLYSYDNNTEDLTAHLTNQFIQKKDPKYKEMKETTTWSMSKFNEYINENVAPDKHLEADWVYTVLEPKMKQIMTQCFNCVKHKLKCKVGYFDLYGLDFMVDEDMKIWLIEVNVNPCLATNCTALKERIPSVVEETLHVALECFEKSRKNQPLMPLKSLKNFCLLYHGGSSRAAAPGRGSPTRSPSPHRRSRSLSPSKDISGGQAAVPSGSEGQMRSRILPPISSSNMVPRFSHQPHPLRSSNPTGTTLANRLVLASTVYTDKSKAQDPAVIAAASASLDSIRLKMTHANSSHTAHKKSAGKPDAPNRDGAKTTNHKTSRHGAKTPAQKSNNRSQGTEQTNQTKVTSVTKDEERPASQERELPSRGN